MSELTAEYKVGRLLALAIVLQFQTGKQILNSRLDENFDSKRKAIRQKFRKGNNETVSYESKKNSIQTKQDNDSTSTKSTKHISKNELFMGKKKQKLQIALFIKHLGISFINKILYELPTYEQQKIYNILYNNYLEKSFLFDNTNIIIPESFSNDDWASSIDLRKSVKSYQLSHSHQSQKIKHHQYPRKKINQSYNNKNQSLNVNTIQELSDFINKLLSFYAFYHYSREYYQLKEKQPDINHIHEKIINMMTSIKSIIQRHENTMGWKTSKFHDLLHITKDMQKFGYDIMNIHTGKGESGLKSWAKKPSKNTQKHQQNTFLLQTSQRIHEKSIITKAFQMNQSINDTTNRENQNNFILKEPLFRYYIQNNTYVGLEMRNKKLYPKPNSKVELHISILNFLMNDVDYGNESYIDLYSCCYRKIDNMTFRAHSNYQNKGPWFDCISTKWDTNNGVVEIPSRCLLFMHHQNSIKVLCHTCNHQTDYEKEISNNIFSHWTISTYFDSTNINIYPKYYLIDVSCINQQEWIIMEHATLFWNETKETVSTKIVWIHNIKTNWVHHFLRK